jgi:DnaK suppressor protein
MSKNQLRPEIIFECRKRLALTKANLMNRLRNQQEEIKKGVDLTGDEIDQTVAQLTENSLLTFQNKIREQLFEIESAFARMELGTFGVCEETEELIEAERLLALPWTRLSIEGAEIREAVRKRFA